MTGRRTLAKVVDIRGISCLGIRSLLGAGLILAVTGCVSANPIISPPARSVESGIYTLFLINLPIDILLFSGIFLLLLWTLKSPLWAAPEGTNKMVALILLAGLAIAVVGAVIDFYGFYELTGVGSYSEGYWPVMSNEHMALAGAGVFVSIFAASFGIARLRIIPSLIPASAITAFNIFAWMMTDEVTLVTSDAAALLAGAIFLFVPPTMFAIIHLYGKRGVPS